MGDLPPMRDKSPPRHDRPPPGGRNALHRWAALVPPGNRHAPVHQSQIAAPIPLHQPALDVIGGRLFNNSNCPGTPDNLTQQWDAESAIPLILGWPAPHPAVSRAIEGPG
jgi:hypothetical protein